MKEKLTRIAKSAKDALLDDIPGALVWAMLGLTVGTLSYQAGKAGAKQGIEEALIFIHDNWGNPTA